MVEVSVISPGASENLSLSIIGISAQLYGISCTKILIRPVLALNVTELQKRHWNEHPCLFSVRVDHRCISSTSQSSQHICALGSLLDPVWFLLWLSHDSEFMWELSLGNKIEVCYFWSLMKKIWGKGVLVKKSPGQALRDATGKNPSPPIFPWHIGVESKSLSSWNWLIDSSGFGFGLDCCDSLIEPNRGQLSLFNSASFSLALLPSISLMNASVIHWFS